MKKLSTLLFVMLIATAFIYAQESTFNKGDKVLNIGLGLGSTIYVGSYYSTQVPPISASFEVGTHDGIFEKGVIGIGGYVGYSAHKWEYSNDWYYKYSDFIIAARGSFHYPLYDKLDTYTGLLLGVEIVSAKEYGDPYYGYNYNAGGSGLAFSWFAGARYYFSDKFAAMAEIGYGITYLNFGVSLKLGQAQASE